MGIKDWFGGDKKKAAYREKVKEAVSDGKLSSTDMHELAKLREDLDVTDAADDRTEIRREIYDEAFDAKRSQGKITETGVLDMAKSEFDVLEVFLKRANRMLTRATISEAIGLTEDPENSRAVDIRIMRLRKKIEEDPGNPRFLRTVRGEGYIFSLPGEDGAER